MTWLVGTGFINGVYRRGEVTFKGEIARKFLELFGGVESKSTTMTT